MADCKISARMTPDKCRSYKSSGSLSCISCPGLAVSEDACTSCVDLEKKIATLQRHKEELIKERDIAVDLARVLRLERDRLRRGLDSSGITINFTGDNETVMQKLIDSCRNEGTDPADDICSLIDSLASGSMTLIKTRGSAID